MATRQINNTSSTSPIFDNSGGAFVGNRLETTKFILEKQGVPNSLGWAQYGDSKYTSGSPFTLDATTPVKTLDLDGLVNTVKTQLPKGVSDFYDVNNSELTPVKSGDGYAFSLFFEGSNTSNNGDATIFVDLETEPFTRLFPKSFRFSRGAGVDHEYYFVFLGYSGDTFLSNGGKIKIEKGTGDSSLYNFILQVHKVSDSKN